MNLFRKEDGSWSRENIVAAVVFLIGAWDVIKPIVPDEYLPYGVAFVGVLFFYLRTTSNGSPIVK